MKKDNARAKYVWKKMMGRCYDPSDKNYRWYGGNGATVCDDWKTFDGFYEWYSKNYYHIKGENTHIDSDMFGAIPKVYAPEYCIIVPAKINCMLNRRHKTEHRGVQERNGRYEVKIRNTFSGENEYKGRYDSLDTAKKVYLECKRIIFGEVVNSYKDQMPEKVFKQLQDFKFTDSF